MHDSAKIVVNEWEMNYTCVKVKVSLSQIICISLTVGVKCHPHIQWGISKRIVGIRFQEQELIWLQVLLIFHLQ